MAQSKSIIDVISLNTASSKLLLLVISIAFLSCSTGKIQDEDNVFDGFTEIERGDTTMLNWDFPNAENIYIAGYRRIFNAKDSLKVSPHVTTRYYFTITNDLDTLEYVWRVFINNDDKIQTGPSFMQDDDFVPSYVESKYVSGKLKAEHSILKRTRITSAAINNNKQYLNVHALITDEFGNFITAADKNSDYEFIYRLICENDTSAFLKTNSIERNMPFSSGISMSVVLDNSLPASSFESLQYDLEQFARSFHNMDNYAISVFNHYDKEITPLSNKISAFNINGVDLPQPSGLNAMYKSTVESLDKLGNFTTDNKKVLVLITFSSDNASIIFDRNDVAKRALKHNIPVYTIGIGDAVDSYSLRYISNFSGGNFYFLQENEINNVGNILNEILFSQRTYYDFTLPISDLATQNCETIKIELGTIHEIDTVFAAHSIRLKAAKHYFNYQAIASFDYKSASLSPDYYNHIKFLADMLVLHSDTKIELIGNSSIEGESQVSMNLALKRAQEVRRKLIEYGAPADNIRVRAEGSNNPIYYLQDEEWQKYINRRVEVRWLDPELLPYEIIAESEPTETDALDKVERWESLGYQSYYERYLMNNIPYYRVKLWGYSTLDSAQKTTETLRDSYDINFVTQ